MTHCLQEAWVITESSLHCKLVFLFCTNWRKTYNSQEVHILSDYQSAITSITSADLQRSHQDVIDELRSEVHVLKSQSTNVNLNWIAGHIYTYTQVTTSWLIKPRRKLQQRQHHYQKVKLNHTDFCGHIKEQLHATYGTELEIDQTLVGLYINISQQGQKANTSPHYPSILQPSLLRLKLDTINNKNIYII